MASVSMAMPMRIASQNKEASLFFSPLQNKGKLGTRINGRSPSRLQVTASLKEKAVVAATSAALTASMLIPQVAEAAGDLEPSLKNFLLSIVSGGVVLAAIGGAVVGVSYFDPVKRG